jgi:hypothetical protein
MREGFPQVLRHHPRKPHFPQGGAFAFSRASFLRNSRETIFPALRSRPETEPAITSRYFQGGEIAKMITLKITALVLGAGLLLGLFLLPDFSPDFVLAIVACFS